jgi:uncharacterized protein
VHLALGKQEHRPWQIPAAPWIWRQSWCDLAFLHWPVPVEVIRPLVPRGLNVQEHDGTAWIGVVPFRMEGVMRRPWPDMPWISAFPELNVRTYVERDGKPGVWFFSLDATNALAVFAARWFHLPYHRAEIAVKPGPDGRFDYRLKRSGCDVAFEGSYAPVGEPWHAQPGTIEHFLTERYCLYAQRPDGRLLRVEVHHAPWPLQRAELEIRSSTMTQPWQLKLEQPPALVHFAERVDVIAWAPALLE